MADKEEISNIKKMEGYTATEANQKLASEYNSLHSHYQVAK